MGNWEKLSTKHRLYLCRAESRNTEETEKALHIMEELIEKYQFVDYSSFGGGSPVLYVLRVGNMRGQRNNPNNCKRFYERCLLEERKSFDYPLIDHANYIRDVDHKAYLVSHTYMERADIEKEIEKIKGYTGFENIKCDIVDDSFYSTETRCVIFYL